MVRSPDASYSTFPLEDERPPEVRPSWEPRSRFELERDITQLRSTNKRLGESLEWILHVLQNEDVNDQERLHQQRNEALESLSHVKDVLLGKVTGVEDSRLVHSKNEDTDVKQPPTFPPSNHMLEPPGLTVSRSLSPSRGPSFDSSTREPSRQNDVRSKFSAPIMASRLSVRSPNMRGLSGKDSGGQKKSETSGDPLGVLR